jgi:hypothetical protein
LYAKSVSAFACCLVVGGCEEEDETDDDDDDELVVALSLAGFSDDIFALTLAKSDALDGAEDAVCCSALKAAMSSSESINSEKRLEDKSATRI